MTSQWRQLWTLYVVTLPLKASRKEWRSVICFLWAKQLNTIEIHSKMHPVYCDNCSTRPAIHDWCKKICSESRKCCWEEKTWPPCCFDECRPMQRLRQFILSYWLDRWDKCLNGYGMYVENKPNVCRLKDLLVKLVHFCRNLQCCLTLASCEGIQLGKILY